MLTSRPNVNYECSTMNYCKCTPNETPTQHVLNEFETFHKNIFSLYRISVPMKPGSNVKYKVLFKSIRCSNWMYRYTVFFFKLFGCLNSNYTVCGSKRSSIFNPVKDRIFLGCIKDGISEKPYSSSQQSNILRCILCSVKDRILYADLECMTWFYKRTWKVYIWP